MSFSELLGNVGLFGAAVMVCLAVVSMYSVALILTKHRHFRSASRQSEEFRPLFTKALHARQFQEVVEAARQHQESHVAQVVSAGLVEYEGARQSGSDPASSFELVTSAVEHSKVEVLIKMKASLGTLATIGSTAPFVGLFGTVVGIINAFRGIAATGSGGMVAVSGGIAEALVATALGIFVAIPAVVSFNHFTGKLENIQVEMNQASAALVNFLFHVPRPDAMLHDGPAAGGRAAVDSYATQSATAAQRAAHAAR